MVSMVIGHPWVKDMWTPKDKNTGHKTKSKRVPNADTIPRACVSEDK